MSGPVDVLAATAEDSSAVPRGMVEVSKEDFWKAVMTTSVNVHPCPEMFSTHWMDLRRQQPWGWTSRGYAGPFDHQGAPPARFALARVQGGAA